MIAVISILWFCVSEEQVDDPGESIPIVPIDPPITEETESRLEFEKNNVLEGRNSPMHFDIELEDSGRKINFVFTPLMPNGTMKTEELNQQISNCVAMIGLELEENPRWVYSGGHIKFVFGDLGEIARVSLPVCNQFMSDFNDWDKAWKYLSDRIQWIKKDF